MNVVIKDIEQWSLNKGLDKSDSFKQFTKATEELGEVASALCKGNTDELKLEIGDVIVTMVILAQQNGLSLTECASAAYNKISGRKGTMVDGIFVKEEDLKTTDWITWSGGDCPVKSSDIVEVVQDCGQEEQGRAGDFNWRLQHSVSAIIMYRLFKS